VAVIDYFYTSISPFAYLGHRALEAVARKHGCAVAYKPFDLAAVWEQSGAVPPAKRAPLRQRYRLVELQRWALFRGLPLNPRPAHFPVDPRLADQVTIALLQARLDPSDFMFRVFSGVWAKDENISDPRMLEACLEELGFDADRILAAAQEEDVAKRRLANSEAAIAADAIGAPTYVFAGETFWGQDRIELLDHMLETGRPPVTTPGN
jgi:2-hydroxychromene-2-carboxylate isomerase